MEVEEVVRAVEKVKVPKASSSSEMLVNLHKRRVKPCDTL